MSDVFCFEMPSALLKKRAENVRNSIRTIRILCVKLLIISSLVKCVSYVVTNFHEILMSCDVYVILYNFFYLSLPFICFYYFW